MAIQADESQVLRETQYAEKKAEEVKQQEEEENMKVYKDNLVNTGV